MRNDARDVSLTEEDVADVEQDIVTLVDDVSDDTTQSTELKEKVVAHMEKVVASFTESEGAVKAKLATVRRCLLSALSRAPRPRPRSSPSPSPSPLARARIMFCALR